MPSFIYYGRKAKIIADIKESMNSELEGSLSKEQIDLALMLAAAYDDSLADILSNFTQVPILELTDFQVRLILKMLLERSNEF